MLKLLLVDDDALFRDLMARRLQREGCDVITCADADEALALEPRPMDAILLDLMLGERSGLDLITVLTQRFKPRELVVLTGYASIAKPVDLNQLLKVLHGTDARQDEPLPTRHVTPAELEWEHLQRVLLEHDGNISSTARALGMHRRTLQRKLKKHSPF